MIDVIVHTFNGCEIIPVDCTYVEDSNIDAVVMRVVNRHFAPGEVLSARWQFSN